MSAIVPGEDNVRVSDAERESAIAALGRAFSEGRLSIAEYDSRVQQATVARLDCELAGLLADLPQGNELVLSGMDQGPVYSVEEIERVYKNGKNTRLAIMGLSCVGVIAATVIFDALALDVFAALAVLIIPIVWLLLYVAKVGPSQWYTPSPRALHRQRRRELREAERLREVQRRVAERERLADLRLERKERTNELTNRALGFVSDAFNNKKP